MEQEHPQAGSTAESAASLDDMQRDDILATQVVAGVMTVIFVIGLVLYTVIAYQTSP